MLKVRSEDLNVWIALAELHIKMAEEGCKEDSMGREEDSMELLCKAVDNCDSALEIDDGCMEAWKCRGDVFYGMEKWENAYTN